MSPAFQIRDCQLPLLRAIRQKNRAGQQVFKGMIGATGLLASMGRLFPEREIFLRSNGQVRFLKISTRAQATAASVLLAALLAWAAATVFMLVGQYQISREQAVLAQKQAAVASSAKTVSSYRASVDEIAGDLQQRQRLLEELVKDHFGEPLNDGELVGKADQKADKPSKISAAVPEARALRKIEQQQHAFAAGLSEAVTRRTAKVEAAIRGFGLNPRTLARQARAGQGGPFIPYRSRHGEDMAKEFAALEQALARLDALEKSLLIIPSGRPTNVVMLSSAFGYRRDPFNGRGAFHAGLDFRGSYGQPILAAAHGRVTFAGQKQGYGNVVEVTHGPGIMTRYAHLSGFNARIGQTVSRGDQIARMGSTGRSTGTHLHFEVRLNGQPINPRRFLEAKSDVLEIQKIAKERFSDNGHRG